MSLKLLLCGFGKVAVLALLPALGCRERSRERRGMAAIAIFLKENTMTVKDVDVMGGAGHVCTVRLANSCFSTIY